MMKTRSFSEKRRAFSAFLYRRLARWITCEVHLLGNHTLALDSKFQTNSLQDVLCHPFYWQLFGWLPAAPELVVDLGAHCGHFSMLADTCFHIQFPGAEPEYVLIEPNPELVKTIHNNLQRSKMCVRHKIYQGLAGGLRSGEATLWVSPRNYLSASLDRGANTFGTPAQFLDLEAIVKGRRIDLLKVDIEGAEFDFVEQYPELLGRVQSVMMEIHEAPETAQRKLYSQLQVAGLRLKGPALQHSGYALAMFQRW
jgi:FkbM family methyltransferase